jgi:hypothetical protein
MEPVGSLIPSEENTSNKDSLKNQRTALINTGHFLFLCLVCSQI